MIATAALLGIAACPLAYHAISTGLRYTEWPDPYRARRCALSGAAAFALALASSFIIALYA